jgi:hypothetical protein
LLQAEGCELSGERGKGSHRGAGAATALLGLLASEEEHLASATRQRTIGPTVVRRFDHEPVARKHAGEVCGGVEADPVLAFAC